MYVQEEGDGATSNGLATPAFLIGGGSKATSSVRTVKPVTSNTMSPHPQTLEKREPRRVEGGYVSARASRKSLGQNPTTTRTEIYNNSCERYERKKSAPVIALN